jgi:C1A family cysteine protease
MKFQIALLVVFCVLFYFSKTSSLTENKESAMFDDLFSQWMLKYTKIYKTIDEFDQRFNIWLSNLRYIDEFNKNPEKSFTLELNEFADLTLEEFRRTKLGTYPPPESSPQTDLHLENLPLGDLPTSVDWRLKGAVSPVKNQRECGACWAFSAAGALEGLTFITGGELVGLSEQQLVDCSKDFGNNGCGGGWMDWAFNYTQHYGIESESIYPYIGWPRPCNYSKAEVVLQNTGGWYDVPANDSDQLAAAVAQQPVSVAIEADSMTFMFYMGGVYNSFLCGTSLDHGVLAVGYGVNWEGKEYWIVKNSWGPYWGERGYIRIIKKSGTGPSMCGIAKKASYPIVKSDQQLTNLASS